jgi:hypothetical protein
VNADERRRAWVHNCAVELELITTGKDQWHILTSGRTSTVRQPLQEDGRYKLQMALSGARFA